MRRVITYSALSITLALILFQIAVPFIPNKLNKVTRGELPLASIQGVIEKNGIIYVGLLHDARIQMYSSDGKYKGYIATHIKPQNFKFKVNDDGTTEVAKIQRFEEQSIFPQDNRSIFYLSGEFPIKLSKRSQGVTQTIIQQPLILSFSSDAPGHRKIHWWCGLIVVLVNLKILIRSITDFAEGKEERTSLIKAIFTK